MTKSTPEVLRTSIGIARAWAGVIGARHPAPRRADLWAADVEGDGGYLVGTSLADTLERARLWWKENREGRLGVVVRPCAIAFPNDLRAQLHVESITEDGEAVAGWSDMASETRDLICVDGGDGLERIDLWDDLDRRFALALREWARDHGAFDARPDPNRPHVIVNAWQFTGPARTYKHIGKSWKEEVKALGYERSAVDGVARWTVGVEPSPTCRSVPIGALVGAWNVQWVHFNVRGGFSTVTLGESVEDDGLARSLSAGGSEYPHVMGSYMIIGRGKPLYLFIRSDVEDTFEVSITLSKFVDQP